MQNLITVEITRQWQVYIPKRVREVLGLDKPGRIAMEVKKDKLILHPKKTGILSLAGKFEEKAKRVKVNLDRIRDYIDYSKV